MAAFTVTGAKDLPLVKNPYETPLVVTVVRDPHPWFVTKSVQNFAIDPLPSKPVTGILWPDRS